MDIINCANTSISITTYKNRFRGWPWWKRSDRILNNGTLSLNHDANGIEVVVFADRNNFSSELWDSRNGLLDPVTGTHPMWIAEQANPDFSNSATLVITAINEHRIVDWNKAKSPYLSQAQSLGASAETENEEIDTGLQVAQAIINGLATGLAALGKSGALPGGGVMGLGSVLISILGGNQADPPQPPNAAEISGVVTKVVQRESDIDRAETAATAFTIASEDLLTAAQNAADTLARHGDSTSVIDPETPSEKLIDTLVDQKRYLSGTGGLRFEIENLERHPEIAMWTLPAYVMGISTWLTIYRLDLIRLALPNGHNGIPVITKTQVNDFLEQVRQQRDALVAAYEAFEKQCEDKIKAAHLDNTLKASELRGLVAKSIIGTDDLSVVHDFRGQLNQIENFLKADLEAGEFTHFWTVDAVGT